jgi:chromosome segregation ATPase
MSCGNSSFDRLESDSFCPPTEGVPAVLSRRIEELEQQLERGNENRRQLAVENEQLHGQLSELRAQDHVSEQSSRQLMAYEQELKTKRNTIELLVAEKSELESKVWKPVLEQ